MRKTLWRKGATLNCLYIISAILSLWVLNYFRIQTVVSIIAGILFWKINFSACLKVLFLNQCCNMRNVFLVLVLWCSKMSWRLAKSNTIMMFLTGMNNLEFRLIVGVKLFKIGGSQHVYHSNQNSIFYWFCSIFKRQKNTLKNYTCRHEIWYIKYALKPGHVDSKSIETRDSDLSHETIFLCYFEILTKPGLFGKNKNVQITFFYDSIAF